MSRIAELEREVRDLKAENQRLREELRLALYRQFGKSSEQVQVPEQLELSFDDMEAGETLETIETVVIAQHERRKKAGRRRLSDSIPRIDVYHDVPDAEKVCACGHTMTRIGEDILEKLEMVPAKVWVTRHHKAKYACARCQGLSDESLPAVRTAAGEPDLFPRSIVSASLLAHVWTAKFCDHLPYYRQQHGFARIGVEISRQDMVNWTLKGADRLAPLVRRIEDAIREGPVIGMDETPVKILDHPRTGTDGTGYMWVARGGPREHPAVRYRFAPGRGSEHVRSFLGGWVGWLQTDGYSAYETALAGAPVVHVGCWAHARRKFVEAEKVCSSPLTRDALGRIRRLYELEKQAREEARRLSLLDEAFVARRRDLMEPFLAGLHQWLVSHASSALPSGAAGKAIAYTLGQWDKLVHFLDHAGLTPDNNRVENAIRPFVIGRKNWMFHGNEAGAQASCMLFTLIETAKLNGWEPHAFLTAVLRRLPLIRETAEWDSLLPWNLRPGEN